MELVDDCLNDRLFYVFYVIVWLKIYIFVQSRAHRKRHKIVRYNAVYKRKKNMNVYLF